MNRALLQVETRGPFAYDAEKSVARFDVVPHSDPSLPNDVQVTKVPARGGTSTLFSQVLELELNGGATAGARPANAPAIKRLHAWTHAPGRLLTVGSQDEATEAYGQDLTHDQAASRTVLTGAPLHVVKERNVLIAGASEPGDAHHRTRPGAGPQVADDRPRCGRNQTVRHRQQLQHAHRVVEDLARAGQGGDRRARAGPVHLHRRREVRGREGGLLAEGQRPQALARTANRAARPPGRRREAARRAARGTTRAAAPGASAARGRGRRACAQGRAAAAVAHPGRRGRDQPFLRLRRGAGGEARRVLRRRAGRRRGRTGEPGGAARGGRRTAGRARSRRRAASRRSRGRAPARRRSRPFRRSRRSRSRR